jgi:hypothetical protein
VNALLVLGTLWLGLTLSRCAATTIFDNSVNDLVTRFNPGTLEVGDEIMLGSTERYLTGFSFEFWGTNTSHPTTFSGPVEARVQFYENTGDPFNGYPTPSLTSFWDSGWFSLGGPTARSTAVFAQGVDFPDGGLYLPMPTGISNMTWSVQFQGMGTDDSVGVDIYSPPVVGSDYPDYWQNNGGTWSLLTNGVPMDFAARMDANPTIPEPSAWALSLIGGLSLLIMVRRLRRLA